MNYKPELNYFNDCVLKEPDDIIVPQITNNMERINTKKLFNEIYYEWKQTPKNISKLVGLTAKLSWVARHKMLKYTHDYENLEIQDFIIDFISSKIDFPNVMK